jgi:exonuclease VII small subunit
MELHEGEEALKTSSQKMKKAVSNIQDRIRDQDLLYESIEAETYRNENFFAANMRKFEKVVERMNRDPRNKAMLILVVLIVCCTYYLIN